MEVLASASPGLSRLPAQLRGEAVLGWLAAAAAMLPCGVTWREKVVPSLKLTANSEFAPENGWLEWLVGWITALRNSWLVKGVSQANY